VVNNQLPAVGILMIFIVNGFAFTGFNKQLQKVKNTYKTNSLPNGQKIPDFLQII
jgi:hypothetical protein